MASLFAIMAFAGFQLLGIGALSSASCVNCQCLEVSGALIFSNLSSDENANEKPESYVESCMSARLNSPKDKFLLRNIRRYQKQFEAADAKGSNVSWAENIAGLINPAFNSACFEGAMPNNEVAARIVRRCDEDSYLATKYVEARQCQAFGVNADKDCYRYPDVLSAMNIVVRFENAAYLSKIVSEGRIGPLLKLHNKRVDESLYVLLQHSEMFPDMQELALQQLEAAYDEDPSVYDINRIAGLADRLQMGKTNQQIYGTHTICEDGVAKFHPKTILEGAELDELRFAKGLDGASAFLREKTKEHCR